MLIPVAVIAVAGVVLLGLMIWWVAINAHLGALRSDDPSALARTRSLGGIIRDSRLPIHIVFVHGMRAKGPREAQTFMRGLCRYGLNRAIPKGDFTPVSREPIDLGVWPKSATVMGQPVWRDEIDWEASRPFVDRYVFDRGDSRPPITVDEVNWWPLIFPLKCRVLVAPECQLSGIDSGNLDLCTRCKPPYHDWLSNDEYKAALKRPMVSGGAALLNGLAKRSLVNWGLSDTAIVLGPMRHLFRRTMEGAFDHAARSDAGGAVGQEFVVVAESLGCFVVMDAATNHHGDSPRAQEVVTATSDLYFLANQFALLELARISDLKMSPVGVTPVTAPPPPTEPSPMSMLRTWAATSSKALAAPSPTPKQIIAFSDPSDVFTFNVPHLTHSDGSEAAIVVNVYDRNEINWFGVAVDPVKAHVGHSANRSVLKLMFRRR